MARTGVYFAFGTADSRRFAPWDAEKTMPIRGVCVADPKAAQCGEVLKGVLKPHQCKLFGKECTPERPIGALMVSSEGACAAHFKYAISNAASTSGLLT